MISGGNATVYVSDMNKAVKFYTEVLEMKLDQRYGDDWAEVKARDGFVIGLHPAKKDGRSTNPGSPGSIEIGLNVDESLETVVAKLQSKGVEFRGAVLGDEESSPVRLAYFADPDGNEMYLCETKQ